jgi:hypothetical protein
MRFTRICLTTAIVVAWMADCASAEKLAGPSVKPVPKEGAGRSVVDFRYAPPEWQMAICLPDDPCKSLVDNNGALLYHFGQGGREFATRVAVEVTGDATWKKQELFSPRVPVVTTSWDAPGLEISQVALAVADLPQPLATAVVLQRVDGDQVNRNWAMPPADVDPSLRDIDLHNGGSLRYEVTVPPGAARRVALALCEGWWDAPGNRVQLLRVEGAEPKTIDTVAEIGKNKAAAFWFDAKDVNADGKIEIVVEAAPRGSDKNAILNGLWVFPAEMKTDNRALLTGKLNGRALARSALAKPGGPARNDLILVRVKNSGPTPRTVKPRLIVDTTLGASRQPDRVVVNHHETVTCSLKMVPGGSGAQVPLEAVTVPSGKSASFFVLYSGGGAIVTSPATLDQAVAALDHAVAYWQKAPLPYGRVQVPDAGIQALIDSSIRNIWQAREIKQGLPAFQVGPTCYRGLWIVDGAFLLEAAAILGAGSQARNGVAYELTNQKADGSIEVMSNYWKENGIVLWTCVRHAQLTQDKAWLEANWPKLQRIAQYIKVLRKKTLENNSPLDDGLQPPGFPDGGIGGVQYEYTNIYWNLLGLRSFVQAAQWLGKTDEAAHWQKEYDDFLHAFRKATARDVKTDAHGHRYLPIRMDGEDLPQRGQWGFCHGVYPGQLFAKDDPLLAGNMAILEATEREGMVYGTGWDATGIWNYFASFYGHAWLWQGRGQKAAQLLYAYANHAAPVLDWREEQSLRGEPFRKVGDMPHNWASAEFIRLAVHLLELDRGDELHLLEGMPAQWLGAGMTTRLSGVATPFGPLHLVVRVSSDGQMATLDVRPLAANCKSIVVHRPDGGTSRIAAGQGGSISFPAATAP